MEDDSEEEDYIADPKELSSGTAIKSHESFEVFKDIEKLKKPMDEKEGDYKEWEKARAKVLIGKRTRRCEIIFEPEL